MGINPKKCLTQLDKNSYMQDRVRGQMMKLNPPEEKKTTQEVANRNGKAPLNKSFEKNNFRSFFKRPPMTPGRLPLNQSPGLQEMAANKRRDRGFQQLTLLPPISHRRLPLRHLALGFLRGHPEGHEPLLTHMLGG